MGSNKIRNYLVRSLMILAIACAFQVTGLSQDPETGTRRIWDTELIKAKTATKTSSGKTTARRRYKVVTPKITTEGVADDAVLGVTIWRLRPSAASDDNAVRILKHKSDNSNVGSWTPERISADTPLSPGQRVRLSIEAARTGFLYVVDRELYADGTMSDPYLIFPSTGIGGGDNQVTVGRMIDLPGLKDDPNYFTLDPSRPDQIGELLSVIISAEPLPGITAGTDAVKLAPDQVDQWEKQWGTNVGQLDLEGGAGTVWTKEERDAGQTDARKLSGNAPSPQTVFYRPGAKADAPLLVNLRLTYGKPAPRKR
ncbi:MAG: hypothetical protein IPM66_20205 [Acidobacteriota bacterium]|nr:MAG: hypothetical protein IPM66_20205 [Acidobacteriota bacterium]